MTNTEFLNAPEFEAAVEKYITKSLSAHEANLTSFIAKVAGDAARAIRWDAEDLIKSDWNRATALRIREVADQQEVTMVEAFALLFEVLERDLNSELRNLTSGDASTAFTRNVRVAAMVEFFDTIVWNFGVDAQAIRVFARDVKEDLLRRP